MRGGAAATLPLATRAHGVNLNSVPPCSFPLIGRFWPNTNAA
jgi:hypothetical protein